MAIQFKCPQCGKMMVAEDSGALQKAECPNPKCKAMVDVPLPTFPGHVACSNCGEPLNVDATMMGKIVQCPRCHTSNVIPDEKGGGGGGCFALVALLVMVMAGVACMLLVWIQ